MCERQCLEGEGYTVHAASLRIKINNDTEKAGERESERAREREMACAKLASTPPLPSHACCGLKGVTPRP